MDGISIIIPVYNVEKYIEKCIKSILKQTFSQFEIILIDDGSTDGSAEICDKWQRHDPRIRCIHQENAGVSVARNTGFAACTGDYILFVDGDDLLAPDMCECLLKNMRQNNSDVSYCGFYNVFADKTETLIPDKKQLHGNEIQYELVTSSSFYTAVWNKLFRRQVLLDIEGNFIKFPQGIYVGEDALWLARVLKNVKLISAVQRPLYYWQRRADSATQGLAMTKIRLDNKSLSELDAYKAMVLELDVLQARKIMCKKYLGLCRDCMVQAYTEKDKVLSAKLRLRIKKDIKIYPYIDFFT